MKTTFKKRLIKIGAPILLGGVTMLAFLSACGGSTGGITPAPATPQTTATNQPTPTSVPVDTATPVPTPTQSAVLPSTPVATPAVSSGSSGDLLAKGKLIFDETAGGVGCAYCHGLDGKGKSAPYIRGAEEFRVRNALIGVTAMSFIKLSDAELTAVVAYLKYLNEQPQGRP